MAGPITRARPNPRRRKAARRRAARGGFRNAIGGALKPGARVLEAAEDEFLRDDHDGDGIWQGRRSGKGGDDAELTPAERSKAVRNSRSAFKKSGAYGAVLDRITDFALGDGVAIEVKDAKTNAWLHEILARPEIDWEGSLRKRVSRLLVDGELLLSAYVQERDPGQPSGNITLGRMDPLGIGDVAALALNQDRLLRVEYEHGGGVPAVVYPIAEVDGPLMRLRLNEDGNPRIAPLEEGVEASAVVHLQPAEPTEGEEAEASEPSAAPAAGQARAPDMDPGEPEGAALLASVFLWQINTLGTRGAPLLTRLLDKAAVLDEAVEEMARKAEYLNRHWLHIEYDPTGDAEKDEAFEARAMDWATSMEPGACLVTAKTEGSGGVAVHVKVADLKVADQKALYEILLDYLLGSQGIPRMWFSSGGDTNRATSAEQGTPIFRSIRTLQADLRTKIHALMSWLIWIGSQSGAPVDTEAVIEITMADVASRDSLRDVEEVAGLAIALQELVNAGALNRAESERILRKVLKAKWFGELLEESDPEAGVEADAETAAGTTAPIEAPSGDLAAVASPPEEGAVAAAEEGTQPTRLAPVDGTGVKPENQEMVPPADPAADPVPEPIPAGTAAAGTGVAGSKPADAVWTGVQIEKLTAITVQVVNGELPLESAVQIVVAAYPLTEAEARAILVPADRHTPPADDAAPSGDGAEPASRGEPAAEPEPAAPEA